MEQTEEEGWTILEPKPITTREPEPEIQPWAATNDDQYNDDNDEELANTILVQPIPMAVQVPCVPLPPPPPTIVQQIKSDVSIALFKTALGISVQLSASMLRHHLELGPGFVDWRLSLVMNCTNGLLFLGTRYARRRSKACKTI